MVSPFLLLAIPAGALVAKEIAKPKEPAAPPGPVPDTPRTRAYADAVRLVEAVRAGRAREGRVADGVSGPPWRVREQLRHPVIAQKDLPEPPRGHSWWPDSRRTDETRSALTAHSWYLGTRPPARAEAGPPAAVPPQRPGETVAEYFQRLPAEAREALMRMRTH